MYIYISTASKRPDISTQFAWIYNIKVEPPRSGILAPFCIFLSTSDLHGRPLSALRAGGRSGHWTLEAGGDLWLMAHVAQLIRDVGVRSTASWEGGG